MRRRKFIIPQIRNSHSLRVGTFSLICFQWVMCVSFFFTVGVIYTFLCCCSPVNFILKTFPMLLFPQKHYLNGCVTSHCHFIDSFPNCWTFVSSSIFIFALENSKVCWLFFICPCSATVHSGPMWTSSKDSFAFGFAWTQNERCQQETGSWGEVSVPIVGHMEAPSKHLLLPGSGNPSLHFLAISWSLWISLASPTICSVPCHLSTPCQNFVSSCLFVLFHFLN